jgi:hypothetical protein
MKTLPLNDDQADTLIFFPLLKGKMLELVEKNLEHLEKSLKSCLWNLVNTKFLIFNIGCDLHIM